MKQNPTANYNGALQQPIASGFTAASTAKEVLRGINLTGKNAVVTGGYAGIGLETVKALAGAGAQVLVPARDMDKATKNLEGIAGVTIRQLDLMDTASITSFVLQYIATGQLLHILINNAGIMWVPLMRDARGYESQLSTNHLGHFQLTAGLWPALKRAGGARVVNVSSFGHQIAPFDFEDPNFERRDYETLQGYGQSKTANNLFTVELDCRGRQVGVRAFSLHPGAVYGTELARVAPVALFQQMGTYDADGKLKPEVAAQLKKVAQGAATSVWCATSPQLNGIGGVYCEDADIAQLDLGQIEHRYDDPSTLCGVKSYSLDEESAGRLWSLSEKLTGITFTAD